MIGVIVVALIGARVVLWLMDDMDRAQEDCVATCLRLGVQGTRVRCDWECSGRGRYGRMR